MPPYTKVVPEGTGQFKLNATNFGKINDRVYVLENASAFFVTDTQFAGGADSTGVANSGAAANATLAAAGAGFTVFPGGTYLVSALTSLAHSKIHGAGATLKPSANSMSVLTLKTPSDLGESDQLLVRDLTIDGTGKTGIIGIDNDGGATSSMAGVLEDVIAYACDGTGIHLRNAQFHRSVNCRAAHNGVGMKIIGNATSGGANSHQHYGLQLNYNTVGLFCDGSAFLPIGHLVFLDPQYLGNTVCGIALFSVDDFTVIGGTPEANGSGAATTTVDGKTVKRADVYLNASTARFIGHQASTQCNPSFLLENGSNVHFHDLASGAADRLVQCDATSSCHLHGCLQEAAGAIQNVATWPDSWVLNRGSFLCMYGQPVHRSDPTLPVLYAEQAPNLADAGGGGVTSSFVEDADLGYCKQLVYSASVGTYNVNAAQVPVGAGVASNDTVITMLVKATADCVIGLEFFDGASPYAINFEGNGGVTLKAGKVTRIVMGKTGIPANGTWYLQIYPLDSTGPTIKVSNLQVYQGAAATPATLGEIAKIIKHGAFNPGPTRATAANLALKANIVNTQGKHPGKQAWDTTNNRVVFAAGRADTDVWKDGVNTTVYTPI